MYQHISMSQTAHCYEWGRWEMELGIAEDFSSLSYWSHHQCSCLLIETANWRPAAKKRAWQGFPAAIFKHNSSKNGILTFSNSAKKGTVPES